jgi:hypothetical protein
VLRCRHGQCCWVWRLRGQGAGRLDGRLAERHAQMGRLGQLVVVRGLQQRKGGGPGDGLSSLDDRLGERHAQVACIGQLKVVKSLQRHRKKNIG